MSASGYDNNVAGGSQETAAEGNRTEEAKRPPYSMHGVLHFLEHEWSRYEKDRAQWEMERAELRVCPCFSLYRTY
jgi:hypothetical protein